MRILLAVALLVAGCTSSAPPPDRRVPPLPPPSSSGISQIACENIIDRAETPSANLEVILDSVALPTKHILQVNVESTPMFAKQGLVVRANTAVELIVSGEDLGHATISWGSPGSEHTHLQVACPDIPGGSPPWVAFPGGYSVDKPRCLTLIVKTGGRQQTVRIAVGTAC